MWIQHHWFSAGQLPPPCLCRTGHLSTQKCCPHDQELPASPQPWQPLSMRCPYEPGCPRDRVSGVTQTGPARSWVAHLTEHDVVKGHPCWGRCQNLLPLKAESQSIACVDPALFICPPVADIWLPPPFGCCDYCCCEHRCANISPRLCFQFSCCRYPVVKLLDHIGIVFLILWACSSHAVFYSSCTIFHFYQQRMRVPVSPLLTNISPFLSHFVFFK